MERHKTHQHLDNQCDDNPDGLLLHFRFEFRGAAMDQIIHNDNIAANHYKYGNQEEEDESHKVDWVVMAHVDDVLHLDAGGEVGNLIGVMLREEQGYSAAQSHYPHPQTRHHGLWDIPQLFTVLWLDDGHVAVSTDQSKQPQSDAGVEDGESCTDSAENISEGPIVLVVVNHSERKQQDEGEIHDGHIYHVDRDRVPLLGGEGKHPYGSEIDYDSYDEDEAVEDQACHTVLHRSLLQLYSTRLHRHVGEV